MLFGSKGFGRAHSASLIAGLAGLVSATGALADGFTPDALPLFPTVYTGQVGAHAPDYTTNQQTSDFQVFNNATGGALQTNLPGGVGSASGILNATSGQLLSVSGSAQADATVKGVGVPITLDDYTGGGTATLRYTLAVFGPSQVIVPLILTGYTQLSESSGSQSTASAQASYGLTTYNDRSLWSVSGGVNTFSVDCEVTNQNTNLSGCGVQSFQSAFSLNAWTADLVGDEVNVHLFASAGANSTAYGQFPDRPGSASASALIDPLIVIDPIWAADHPGFSVAFGENIVNGAGAPPPPGGVPEPSAWALMIAGFGLAGAALRRRALVSA